ncbi:type II toxin-antitoxin system RelE/ParE family toxin [Anaerolineales bacterium HSG6]|nr:type II toxin-antitoxin system RelE/ParE family toxin [Anaerolineales bacterium HSG6]MDM8530894.1 type II toxin-antitoxin system RelE/ParE family toxin [Anaerolineales bacterium HSG25]
MYEVEFTDDALDDLAKLSKDIGQRILKKIRWLAENFESLSPEPLTNQWQGMYKLRVGDYRVVYTFESETRRLIIVHLIGHRREVYKSR